MKSKTDRAYQNDDYTPFAGPHYQEQGQRTRSDGRIHEEIWETLSNDPHLNMEAIEIEVVDGIVTLRGRVESRGVKRSAEVSIEHIEGVKDIFNLITLNEFEDMGSEGLVKHQSHLD